MLNMDTTLFRDGFRYLCKQSPLIFGALTAIGAVIMWGSMRWLKVNEHTIYFDNLPEHLEGFRILQIADLHNRSAHRKTLDIWPVVRRLNFDIAAITGDVILDKLADLQPHREDFKKLAKRVPTFFIEGNHEKGDLFSQIKCFFEEIGVTVLDNQVHVLAIGSGQLDIIGTRDYITLLRTRQRGFHQLFSPQRETTNFQLVLTHQPQTIHWFSDSGADLVLTGHTHGGQIRLPFLPTLYAPLQGFFPKYGDGFYQVNGTTLYVSRGIGATNFPFRLFNRPELSVFELARFCTLANCDENLNRTL